MQRSQNVYYLLDDQIQLIHLIDRLLTDLLNQTAQARRAKSIFDCSQKPSISILDYLKRRFQQEIGIAKYSHCSSCVFVASLIYIDRLQERIQEFFVNFHNIHRLLITTVMVGAKFLDDFYYKNEFYAKIGGIGKADLNQLEIYLVKNCEFGLFISQSEFNAYLDKISTYKDVNK